MNDEACGRCAGCGKIADSDSGEAWTHWESLPPGSDLAVRAGIVKPIPCPDCGGSGKRQVAAPDAPRCHPGCTKAPDHCCVENECHTLIDYRNPPSTPRADRLAVLEQRVEGLRKELAQESGEVLALENERDAALARAEKLTAERDMLLGQVKHHGDAAENLRVSLAAAQEREGKMREALLSLKRLAEAEASTKCPHIGDDRCGCGYLDADEVMKMTKKGLGEE